MRQSLKVAGELFLERAYNQIGSGAIQFGRVIIERTTHDCDQIANLHFILRDTKHARLVDERINHSDNAVLTLGNLHKVVPFRFIGGRRRRKDIVFAHGPDYSWPALSGVTIVDAVSRQRLTAAPSLSACALISLPR